MTDYTSLPDTLFQAGKRILASTALRTRDNVIATAWHAYDGLTGEIYNRGPDPQVASITTPDFVAGYAYRIVTFGLTATGGNGTIDVYREGDASFQLTVIGNIDFTAGRSITFDIPDPRILAGHGSVDIREPGRSDRGAVTSTTDPDRILRIRINSNSAFTAGRMFMYRQKTFLE